MGNPGRALRTLAGHSDDVNGVVDQGVQFVGINVRDSRQAGADFARDFGLTYPSIYDPPGRTLFALPRIPRSVVPLTIVLDREHRVAAVFLRELLAEDLLPVVQRIAAEP